MTPEPPSWSTVSLTPPTRSRTDCAPNSAGMPRCRGSRNASGSTEIHGPWAGRERTMHGWAVSGHSGAPGRLVPVERETPAAGPGEVGVRVLACGVCRTDLHLADGDLVARAPLRI